MCISGMSMKVIYKHHAVLHMGLETSHIVLSNGGPQTVPFISKEGLRPHSYNA